MYLSSLHRRVAAVNDTHAAAAAETAGTTLTAEQRDGYARKGFCMIPDLIDATLLATLREEYDAELRSPTSGFHNIAAPPSSDHASDKQAPEPGGEVMLQRINMCEISMAFRRLLYNDRMLDAAEELMALTGDEPTGLQLYHDQALYKPAADPRAGSFGTYVARTKDNSAFAVRFAWDAAPSRGAIICRTADLHHRHLPVQVATCSGIRTTRTGAASRPTF